MTRRLLFDVRRFEEFWLARELHVPVERVWAMPNATFEEWFAFFKAEQVGREHIAKMTGGGGP